jgi:hypothetical protein
LAPLLRKIENIGGGGSIASTFETGNTIFYDVDFFEQLAREAGWRLPT